ncbi:MAG: hypothetical protein IT330_08570 [Anaerolineae bacterium]|nr:hypothetical protein [Anaerolineae bacterium]
MTVNLVVKVPEDLRRRARAVAVLRGETISDVVRARLEEYIREAQADEDAAWKRLAAEQFLRSPAAGGLITPAKHKRRVASPPLALEGRPLSELLDEVRGE